MGVVEWLRGLGDRLTIPAMTDYRGARELLTVSGVSERCRVSRQTVYAWLREGRIRPAARYRSKSGWVPLFDPDDVTGEHVRRRDTRA